MNQIIIAILGIITIVSLSSRDIKYFNIGYFAGILSQPFWLYETINKAQYGMLILSIIYTLCHFRGLYNYYKRKNDENFNRN